MPEQRGQSGVSCGHHKKRTEEEECSYLDMELRKRQKCRPTSRDFGVTLYKWTAREREELRGDDRDEKMAGSHSTVTSEEGEGQRVERLGAHRQNE